MLDFLLPFLRISFCFQYKHIEQTIRRRLRIIGPSGQELCCLNINFPMQPHQLSTYPPMIPVAEDTYNPARDSPPCNSLWSCFIQARIHFLFSLIYGLWCLGDARGGQCPKTRWKCKSSYSLETDHPCCCCPRTMGHCRWKMHTDHESVLTREQDFYHSFPRKFFCHIYL